MSLLGKSAQELWERQDREKCCHRHRLEVVELQIPRSESKIILY